MSTIKEISDNLPDIENIGVADEDLTLRAATTYQDDHLNVEGRVHSIETFSGVDGPGVRMVVFLQGCPRRCKFCSNPDTWDFNEGGKIMTVAEVAARLKRIVPYMKGSGGGLTCSGGEPIAQPHFVAALFKEAHNLGVNTALDTTGYGTPKKNWDIVIPETDVVLLCPKSLVPSTYKYITENTIGMFKKFCDYLNNLAPANQPKVWMRYVLMVGVTDSDEELNAFLEFMKTFKPVVGIELLPYHKLGLAKWEKLGIEYPLKDMETPPRELSERVKKLFESHGFHVLL
eukprot:GCRY01000992.1.p1 GENE.GCRY01000992.1~~GCRY01000992.1.p1  ORF type:complete len:287 (+),score=51.75 GCRY01000992.1:101-961(+)